MTSIHARVRPAEFSPPSPTISTISTLPQPQESSNTAAAKSKSLLHRSIRSTSPSLISPSSVLQPATSVYTNRSASGMELDIDENQSPLDSADSSKGNNNGNTTSRKRTVTTAMGSAVVDGRNGNSSLISENKALNSGVSGNGKNDSMIGGGGGGVKSSQAATKRKGLRRL